MPACRHPALILCLGLLGVPSLAEASRATAVVPLLSVNLEEAEVDRLTEALAQALQQTTGGTVQGGRPVRRRLPEGGLSPDCPADPSCVAQLQTRLEADGLVFVILTQVGARVQVDPSLWLDGRSEPRPALRGSRLELMSAAWLAPQVKDWLPQAAAPLSATAPAVGAWRGPSWPVWVAAGVGAGALALGIGFGVSAAAKERSLVADGCELRRCADADIDALARTARVADAAFIVAGVATVAGLGLYYALDVGPEPLALRVHPQGLSLVGQF